MVKTRRSNRGKRKGTLASSSSRLSKPRNAKNKTPKKSLNVSSNSETSPFKGFDDTNKSPKLFASLLEDSTLKDKNEVFDSLFDNHKTHNLHRNIKTYTNKHKKGKENGLLDFEDHKLRYDVVKWLNDTRNVFDRMTQTQTEFVEENDNQMSLDLPSVSQQNTSKLNRSTRESRRHQTPYKLRARSLDIQVKKNGVGGRGKRHSLAGESPDLENYLIEEAVTDGDVATPAKNARVIIDLMEDEYLDNLEREILQQDDKKGGTGWERIKDMNKTLNYTKKPKQLNIILEPSQKKKSFSSTNSDYGDYNLGVLENYFVENMRKLLGNDEKSKSKSPEKFSVKNGLQVGKNFLMILKKIVENEGNERLGEFQFLMKEINSLFTVFLKSSATQTRAIPNSTKTTQTVPNVRPVIVQTESNLIHTAAQTDILQNSEKSVQIELNKSSVEIQTELNPLQRVPSQGSTSSTVSDLFLENEREENVNNVEVKNSVPNQNDVFDDDLDLDFDTEEFMKNAETSRTESANFSKIEADKKYELSDDDLGIADLNTEDVVERVDKKVDEEEKVRSGVKIPITGQSDLLISDNSSDVGNKGVKRVMRSPVYDPEIHRSKRPCAKFMAEHLSVGFNSCIETQEDEESREVVKFSEESDVDVNDEYIAKLLKKYENQREQTPQPPPKTRTQEQIEELENIIHNAAKPNRSVTNHKQTQRRQISHDVEDDFDYFNSESERTPKSSRRSLFDAKNDDVKTSPAVLSESIFASEINVTVIADQTFTHDNVDTIMKNIDVSDKGKSDKIKVLDNVIIHKAKNDGNLSETSEEVHFSDGDFVESTPQKKYPSFVSHREESVLDITLPPPLEFQDMETETEENKSKVAVEEIKAISPLRRPLAVINKVTSTPLPSKNDSENFLSLSPISFSTKRAKSESEENKKPINRKKTTIRETIRGFTGENKFSPLSIIKKPQSQDCRLSSTPKQQRSILNFMRASQESQESSASFEGSVKRKPCIACSRVTRDQVMAISSLTNKKLATYSNSFTPKITHLIVATNERNQLKDHTIKFVGAVASGIWVLSFGWVKECLLKNCLVPEEPFEVLDVSGEPGPRISRMTRNTNPLLKGYKIYAAVPFVSTTQQEIENVVRLLGGKVVPAPEYLLEKNGHVCVIVTEARATQDFALYETWLEALKVVTVDIEWLSRSVGQYKLLSLRPFTLCADETLDSLGYPPELTVNMTYSFSQQTFSSVPSSSSL